MPDNARNRVILVSGPSGAGRSTAINALEDLGFETIDNMPIRLVERLITPQDRGRRIALGLDVRNRDFSPAAVLQLLAQLSETDGIEPELMFLECAGSVLLRRYSETRRRHPMAPEESPEIGIQREQEMLGDLRDRADILIDTTELSPHQLRAEIEARFTGNAGDNLALTIQSYSYKRGMPQGLDMALDVRFLRNPYWDPALRALNGKDGAVGDYVRADARFVDFITRTQSLVEMLLPAYVQEGKAHFTIGFGCTGGQHRSVFVAEFMAQTLAQQGWRVSIRHREVERREKMARRSG